MTTTTSSLAHSLAAFQAELPAIHKGETANVVTKDKGRYSYTYASLGDISRVVLPLLGKHGLSWVTMPALVDGRFVLRYTLMHVNGGTMTGDYPLNGNTPQEIGSSITYARRYTLCSVTGVAPDEDDDGRAASTVKPAAPYTPTASEIRSVIATVGMNKGMKPDQIAGDFESWSQGAHIGTTEDVILLGQYLDRIKELGETA